MDKKQFCEQTASKIKEVERFVQLQRGGAPATAQKTAQLEEQRPRREEAGTRAEKLRGRLDAVCADPAPLTDAVRYEIEQELAAVRKLLG